MQNFFYLILVVALFSCSKEDEKTVTPDLGHDYAGLEVGKFVVYDVDSHYISVEFEIDTLIHFQIKEVIDSKYTDLEGDEAFKIIRYHKLTDTTNWTLTDVWNAKLTTTNYQKVEENVRFIKLIFPVKNNSTWNGNSFNNQNENTNEYTTIDKQETIGGNTLDNVLTVLQLEEINLVEEKIYKEKYAKEVGLVYKRHADLSKKYNTLTGVFEPDEGFDVTMTLSSYSN